MQQDIINQITTIFSSVDERNWKKIERVMADKVLLDYTSLNGGEASLLTPQEITTAWAAMLPGFDRTHHQVSDFDINADGNMAAVHYNGRGDHFLGNEVWSAIGTFDTELRKTQGEWRITKHTFNMEKQDGNTQLPLKAKQIVKHRQTAPRVDKVEIDSDGLIVVGNLYKPYDFDESKNYPAILVGGSWTTIKEQMGGLYAEELARQGFITLAIDPRYFGESEGKPRFWENPEAKIADYKNAVAYLKKVSSVDVDNLFLVAVCASAGYMANVVKDSSDIKAFATVAAWLHDAESVKPLYGGEEGVKTKLKQAKEAKQKFAAEGEADYVPTVSKTDKNAAMAGDFPYYLDPKRGAVPEWSADKFAVMSWEDWLTFDPMPVAKKIKIPTLIIHADDAALPDNAKKFFEDISTDDKVLYWTEGTQFDFYDQPKQVAESVAAVTTFFKTHLR